ncbi:MAG: LysR family transcriptional regulator [Alphaproteobacteria bacterium]|nr:LysR family transcriptional regulator [Alphaproteobacteria bacterium]
MDTADLKLFETVARHGSMSRAAAELNTVQSAVTARIRRLETELDTPLLHRHSRGVRLTDAGQRLLPFARRLVTLMTEARQGIVDGGVPGGLLTVGSLETTAALRLTPLLAGFVAAFPLVDLVLRTGTSAELIEQVAAGQLEGAFVCGPVSHGDLLVQTMFREELMLATGWTIRRVEQLRELRELKIVVLRLGCSYRQRLEEILARRGIVGLRRLEFGTIEAILGTVAAGIGVTLLPRSVLERGRRERPLALHALPPAEAQVETLFVRRRDGYLSGALAALLAHIRSESRRQAAE